MEENKFLLHVCDASEVHICPFLNRPKERRRWFSSVSSINLSSAKKAVFFASPLVRKKKCRFFTDCLLTHDH